MNSQSPAKDFDEIAGEVAFFEQHATGAVRSVFPRHELTGRPPQWAVPAMVALPSTSSPSGSGR